MSVSVAELSGAAVLVSPAPNDAQRFVAAYRLSRALGVEPATRATVPLFVTDVGDRAVVVILATIDAQLALFVTDLPDSAPILT